MPFEELFSFLGRIYPWELERHIEVGDGVAEFRERIPFERALAYLLARRGRLSQKDAELVAAGIRQHELSAIVDSFLYRMWLCRVDGRSCKEVVDAFSKIVAVYRKVLP
ncbi:hypothetical protein [Thermofilum pendens]